MIKFVRYLRYVVLHKWYVGVACFKHGLYWRGLKHDWSKLLPSEFFPYAESFYGGWKYNERPTHVVSAFDAAWLKHQHRNSHHWQHWVLREDSGATKFIEMPRADAIEMVCDWIGAGLAISGRADPTPWYEQNRERILLHPNTRVFVEQLLREVCK